jgi:hypothetical protein
MNLIDYKHLTKKEKIQLMASCKRVSYRTTSLLNADNNFQTFYIGRLAGIDIQGVNGLRHTTKQAALDTARSCRADLRAEAKELGIHLS